MTTTCHVVSAPTGCQDVRHCHWGLVRVGGPLRTKRRIANFPAVPAHPSRSIYTLPSLTLLPTTNFAHTHEYRPHHSNLHPTLPRPNLARANPLPCIASAALALPSVITLSALQHRTTLFRPRPSVHSWCLAQDAYSPGRHRKSGAYFRVRRRVQDTF